MQAVSESTNFSIVKSETVDFDEFYGRPHQSSSVQPESCPQFQEMKVSDPSNETLQKTQSYSKIIFKDGHFYGIPTGKQ